MSERKIQKNSSAFIYFEDKKRPQCSVFYSIQKCFECFFFSSLIRHTVNLSFLLLFMWMHPCTHIPNQNEIFKAATLLFIKSLSLKSSHTLLQKRADSMCEYCGKKITFKFMKAFQHAHTHTRARALIRVKSEWKKRQLIEWIRYQKNGIGISVSEHRNAVHSIHGTHSVQRTVRGGQRYRPLFPYDVAILTDEKKNLVCN